MDKEQNIIIHKIIPFEIITKIVESIKNIQPKISFETGFKTYTLGSIHNNLPYDNKEIIFNINSISKNKISLISMYFEGLNLNTIDDVCSSINLLFGKYCIAYRNTNYIDVIPAGCSKGNALNPICSSIDIDYNNLYTIGDSFNDISMY